MGALMFSMKAFLWAIVCVSAARDIPHGDGSDLTQSPTKRGIVSSVHIAFQKYESGNQMVEKLAMDLFSSRDSANPIASSGRSSSSIDSRSAMVNTP